MLNMTLMGLLGIKPQLNQSMNQCQSPLRPFVNIFLIPPQKICCGYSLEAPWRGASNEYPQHMLSLRNKKESNILVEKKKHLLWNYGYMATVMALEYNTKVPHVKTL